MKKIKKKKNPNIGEKIDIGHYGKSTFYQEDIKKLFPNAILKRKN